MGFGIAGRLTPADIAGCEDLGRDLLAERVTFEVGASGPRGRTPNRFLLKSSRFAWTK